MSHDPANLLREHGVQVTAQRLAVLQAVSRRPHSTADDVAEEVRGKIGAISRQAVYDALGMLAEKGLIRRIQPAGSSARYEDRVGDNHHHVICRTCGKTVDVDCAVGEAPCLTAADNSGYQIVEAEVIYWGICPDCLSRRPGVGWLTTRRVPECRLTPIQIFEGSYVSYRNNNCGVSNAVSHRISKQRFCRTIPTWLVAVALGCLTGSQGPLVLAQTTGADPLKGVGEQPAVGTEETQPAGPHRAPVAAGIRCPVTGLTVQSPVTTGASVGLHRQGKWSVMKIRRLGSNVEPGLVAESVEPADPSTRIRQRAIRWARISITPKSSRSSTSMP